MALVLHYPGDRTRFDDDQVLGPDTAFAYYAPVSAEYDADTDVTEVRYRPIPPAELATRIQIASDRMETRQRIRDLFNTEEGAT